MRCPDVKSAETVDRALASMPEFGRGGSAEAEELMEENNEPGFAAAAEEEEEGGEEPDGAMST